MNEFLLFAVVVVYLAIWYGKPIKKTSSDQQGSENQQSSHPARKPQN
jgi:hypothetical protein